MKKNLLSGIKNSLKASSLLFGLFMANFSFAQYNDGDYRTRLNNSGWGGATTWEVYSSATGAWTVAAAAPGPTNHVIIKDGATHTSNVSGATIKSMTIGEGGAAMATAVLTNGSVTAVNVTDPGQLAFIPGVTFIGNTTPPAPAATIATATVASVKVTGAYILNPGSGYTNATVTFADAPAGGTTATGTAVITGDRVTGINITNPGTGYTSVPAITIAGDGTGAAASSKVGIEAINVTSGGSGYTEPPTVVLGTVFMVGNATTARTFTVSDTLTFKKGAQLISGGGGSSVTQTLNLGGDLSAVTPVSFITRVPTSTSQTTINFTKAGTQTVSGLGNFTFRNITVGASTVLAVNSEVNIAGTIGLNSTGQIDASNGTIGFVTYATTPVAQTIANNTFKDALVRNLVINNTSGVILNQNLAVTNLLTLSAGILNLPSTGVLQLNATNQVAGTFGPNSHINTTVDPAGPMGMVQINNVGTTERILPLGNNGNYLPVSLAPTSVSTFTASVFAGATENGTPGGTPTANKDNIVDAIYNINRIGGTGNVMLTLGFPSSLKGSGFTGIQNNQLGISRFNSTAWENVTGFGDNTQNFATATFSNFSPFRVEVNLNPTVFPVKLGDITAAKSNGQSVIRWNVYNEVNVSSYVIERSVDGGRTYSEVGSIKATGNSSYSFVDARPTSGKNLYRLRSVDADSRATYSKILLVDFSKISASLSVSPNPVINGMFTVRFANMKEGKVTVRLYSNIGQLIMNQPISYNGSTDNQLINLPAGIAKGNYQLVITDGTSIQKASVIVQ